MNSAEDIAAFRRFPNIGLAELEKIAEFDYDEQNTAGSDSAPPVLLSIFYPKRRVDPQPVVYYLHGGGMVAGDRFNGIDQVLAWVERLGVVMVAVEYRLAPEHPHPAPIDDCDAGLLWVAEHADELGIDANRVVVVGASAGGGLAAALALRARDRGYPRLAGQVLDSPMLDDRSQTVSSHQVDNLGIWDRITNEVAWTALLGEHHAEREISPYASPSRAEDLSRLPPTYISAAGGEVFRDEAIAYASGIWAAGGSVDLHVYAGAMHSFKALAPESAISRTARADLDDWVQRLLARRIAT